MKKLLSVLLSALIGLLAAPSAPAHAFMPAPENICGLAKQAHADEYKRLKFDAAIRRKKPEIELPYQFGLELTRGLSPDHQAMLKGAREGIHKTRDVARVLEQDLVFPLNDRIALRPLPGDLNIETHLRYFSDSIVVQVCAYHLASKQPVSTSTCLSVDLMKDQDVNAAWANEAERASWAPEEPMSADEYVKSKTPSACRKAADQEVAGQKIDDADVIKSVSSIGKLVEGRHLPGVGSPGAIEIR